VALLELGDTPAMDAELAARARLAEDLRQPLYLWYTLVLRTMRTLLDGRFAEAERLAEQAVMLGHQAQYEDGISVFTLHLFALRREQGRLAELEPIGRSFVERYPVLVTVRCALAVLYCELGRTEDARREFDLLVGDDLAELPEDGTRIAALALLAEVCAFLGDAYHAGRLYTALLPFARYNVVLGAALACVGSTSRYLGLLATAMARWDEAARHYEDAIAMHTRMGARPWLAHTQHDYAAMLLQRAAPGDHERARDLIAHALTASEQLGMTRLSERCRTLLDQLEHGIPEPRPHPALEELRIEIDEARRARQVAEITDHAFFQELVATARDMRARARAR
jgi:tetratricopeptide (TPR) repeat protein